MTTKNIREFLQAFSVEELKERGILRGTSNLLKGISIDPLITLMQEYSVKQLEYPERNWFLDVEGNFRTHASAELKDVKVAHLSNPGSVFNYTNTTINPYYQGPPPEPDGETAVEEAEEITFGLERDLQAALRGNIEQLESGLKVVDGGTERRVKGGRIDITAEDREENLVAIELKAGMARPDSITQTLAYMASLVLEERRPVRGILVAEDFDLKVILAAQAVPNLQLKGYSFSFSFRDR